MSELVYLLCALTCLMCAVLLWRGYRSSGARLLLWSTLCFVGLTLNNILLFIDKFALPNVDLLMLRNATALIALLPLLFGLIWDSQ
jgi:hydrogenase/urease accessory protein HupE